MPDVQLLSDNTQILAYAQGAKRAGITPNPYEGIMAASGPLHSEYEKSDNWEYCKMIYKTPDRQDRARPRHRDPLQG